MSFEVAINARMTEELPPGAKGRGHDTHLSALAGRALAGEPAAFDQLMASTQQKVAATAWRLLGSREDARDATQETFLRAYKYLKGYRPEQDFHGWLYRITVNVCRDMLRARRAPGREPPPGRVADYGTTLAVAASVDDTEESAALAQQRAIVGRALKTLPEKERTAVVLRDLEGLSTEEVARAMNTRPATVRSQVSTARAKLKLYCERYLGERRPGGIRE